MNIGVTDASAMRMKIGSSSFWMISNWPSLVPEERQADSQATAPMTLKSVNAP
jgi:hypothetical protein